MLAVLNEALAWKNDEYSYVCPKVAERYNKEDERGKNIGNNLVDLALPDTPEYSKIRELLSDGMN